MGAAPGNGSSGGWTRERVEHRLIAAFRALPGMPVYGHARGVRPAAPGAPASPLTDVLNWARLLDRDPDARKYLWAWARCRAMRDSFRGYCRGMGWKPATAEDARRRGAMAIAAALNAKPAR